MNNFLLIIDGSSLLATQYFGNLPEAIMDTKLTEEERKSHYSEILQTSDGVYTNAIYGFFRVLLKIIKDQQPSHIVINWDAGRNTFRRKMYPAYKGTRDDTQDPLKQQFEYCQKALKFIGIKQFLNPEYEADDFSGSLAKRFENEILVRIYTKDKDHLQLISRNTNIWLAKVNPIHVNQLFKKHNIDRKTINLPDCVFKLDEKLLMHEYGVTPNQALELKALMGDSGDNIPGVPGIGDKYALPLIQHYGSIENLYNSIRNLSKEQIVELKEDWKNNLGIKKCPIKTLLKESVKDSDGNIIEYYGEDAAILSKKLGKIYTDINFGPLTLDDLKTDINQDNLLAILKRFEFNSLIVKPSTTK